MKKAALVVPGFEIGGGVPRLAKFMLYALTQFGYEVTVFEVATSRIDPQSSRITSPKTWIKNPAIVPSVSGVKMYHCGSHFAEFEPLRYMPRRDLTNLLNSFDFVQLIAGTPAWANILREVQSPKFLQVATITKWERVRRDGIGPPTSRFYRHVMTNIANSLDTSGVRLVDHVLVLNKEMESWAAGVRGSRQGVAFAPSGIDTEFFSPNHPWSPTDQLISVGRLGEPRKGWDRLLRAYAYAVGSIPALPNLRLLGKGNLRANDFSLIKELGISERVSIVRDVTDLQLLEELQRSSIFVQMSHEEGLGLGALEAMACGLPVIATDTFGSREYVTAETGFLLDQNELTLNRQFQSSIQAILGSEGASMSEKSRSLVVQVYGYSQILEQLAGFYAKMS